MMLFFVRYISEIGLGGSDVEKEYLYMLITNGPLD